MGRAKDIRKIENNLYSIRVEIQQEITETQKKARRFDMLCELTAQEEDAADALNEQQELLETQLDAIDGALVALSYFNALK